MLFLCDINALWHIVLEHSGVGMYSATFWMRFYYNALVYKVESKNVRLAVRLYRGEKKKKAQILENTWKKIKLLFFSAFYFYEKRSLRAILLFGIIPHHVEMQDFE